MAYGTRSYARPYLYGNRLPLGDRVRFFSQRNEYRGIAVHANARVSARDRRLDARTPAMRRHHRRYCLTRHAVRPFCHSSYFSKNRAAISGLLPPPFTGEGWEGGKHARIFLHAPSLPLPRKRGRECTERAALWVQAQPNML